MNKKINIGKTYNGVFTIPGLLIILASLLLVIAQLILISVESINSLNWNYIVFVTIAIPIGQILFIAQGGICVDEKIENLMLYYSYFGIKIGHWRKIEQYDSVRIKRSSENKNAYTRTGLHSLNYKTYDVILQGQKPENIKSFGAYDKALVFLHEVSMLTGLEEVDEIVLLKSSSLKRRKYYQSRRSLNA
jgi:hypothetical protein